MSALFWAPGRRRVRAASPVAEEQIVCQEHNSNGYRRIRQIEHRPYAKIDEVDDVVEADAVNEVPDRPAQLEREGNAYEGRYPPEGRAADEDHDGGHYCNRDERQEPDPRLEQSERASRIAHRCDMDQTVYDRHGPSKW